MKIRAIGSALALAIGAACASGGEGSAQGGAYQEEMGPAVATAVERESIPILERFGYTVVRRDDAGGRLMLETQWVPREANAREAAAGVRDVRTRIIVTTRPRSTTNSAGQSVSGVTLRYEVEHLQEGRSNWVPAATADAEVRALVKRIADAIRLELQVKGMQG